MAERESPWQIHAGGMYDVRILEESGLVPGAQNIFDRLQRGEMSFTHAGADHDVYVVPDQATIKRIKPTSGEALVWALGVEPEHVRAIQKGEMPVPKGIDSIDWSMILSYSHQAHGAITEGFGKIYFLSTLFVEHGGRAYRVQPAYPVGGLDAFAKKEIAKFYSQLDMQWDRVGATDRFVSLPWLIQKYYRYFHLDDGGLSNAVYRGPTAKPPALIFDY